MIINYNYNYPQAKRQWNLPDSKLAMSEMAETITACFGINSNNAEVQF
jgi:hypothetical protein